MIAPGLLHTECIRVDEERFQSLLCGTWREMKTVHQDPITTL
jgi:hypothetical protein